MDCLVAACSGGQQAAAVFSCPRMPCWDTDVVEVSSIKANCTFFPWTNAAPSSEQACPVGVYLHSPLQRDTKGLIWAPPAGSACKRVSLKWLLLKTRRKEQSPASHRGRCRGRR